MSNGSFGRRTWDREEYARRLKESRESKEETKDQPKTSTSRHDLHKSRLEQLDAIASDSGSSFLISQDQAARTGKRGRGIGFYCEACDLTFKDDYELVSHLNSKQHFQNAGVEYVDTRDITLEMIQSRVELLLLKRLAAQELLLRESGEPMYNIEKRIQQRREFQQRLALKKKQKRLAKQLQKLTEPVDHPQDEQLMLAMGFAGFGSTKS